MDISVQICFIHQLEKGEIVWYDHINK